MVEDAVASDKFLAWHGCGWRRTQPLVTSSGVVRSVDSGAWTVEDVATGDEPGVGRGGGGRDCQQQAPTWGVAAKDEAAGDDLRRGAWTTADAAAGAVLRHGPKACPMLIHYHQSHI